MSAPSVPSELIAGRECGSCVSCCSFFSIAELGKPAGLLCSHSCPGGGCDTYETRPNACRVFFCAWRCWDRVGEDWRPDRTGFILGGRLRPGEFLSITVDPALPQAWRDPSRLPQLRAWAREAALIESHVVVFVGARVIQLAEAEAGDVDFGEIGPDEVLIKEPGRGFRKVPRPNSANKSD
jgi:hypothetical protein